MVQRILATLLIVLGIAGIGLGVASATVWRGDDTVVAQAVPTGGSALVVTDPGVLDLVDGDVSVRATVPDGQKVTLAIGREVDVLGWVGEDPYDRVTGLSDWETLSVTPGGTPAEEPAATDPSASADPSAPADASAPAADPSAAASDGASAPAAEGEPTGTGAAEAPSTLVGPEPAGNDMWIAEASGESAVTLRWSDQPGRWVLLAAGVGDGVTPPTIELTWPRVAPTPYLWPGVLGGAFLVLLGLVVLLGARRVKRRVAASRPGRAVSSVASAARSQVSRGSGTSRRGDRDTGPQDPPSAAVPPAGPGAEQADGGAPGERQNPFVAAPFAADPVPAAGAAAPGQDDHGNPWGAAPQPDPTSQGALRRFRSEAPATAQAGPAGDPYAGAQGLGPAASAPDHGASQGHQPGVPPAPVAPAEEPLLPGAPATGLRRSRRRLTGAGAAPVAPQAAPPGPAPAAEPSGAAGAAPFGGPVAGQPVQGAPVPGSPATHAAAPGGYDAPGGEAPSGRTLTRRELRLREQAERRAATGAMPAVPEAQDTPEPQEAPQEQPSSRASAWRQTWGFSGDEGGER